MAKPNQERLRTKLRKLLPFPFRSDCCRPAQIWDSKNKRFSCQMKVFKVSSKSSRSDKHEILLHVQYLQWHFEHTFQKISLALVFLWGSELLDLSREYSLGQGSC